MENKTTIVGIVAFVILAIGGMFWLGNSEIGRKNTASAVSSEPSLLTATETDYDFGTISMKNGNVEKIFRLANSTSSDITVEKVATSCMCTKAYVESKDGEKGPFGMESMGYVPKVNERVKPGDSLDIKVVYDPNAHGPAGVGAIDRQIFVKDSQGRTLTLRIKAVVTP